MQYFVFSDASLDPASNQGVGAILILPGETWKTQTQASDFNIRTRNARETNIALLELETALWALEETEKIHSGQGSSSKLKIRLFIDCLSIKNLITRRAKLELGGYQSKRSGKTLAHAATYQAFFSLVDRLHPEIEWVKGHSPSAGQTEIERVFSQVDRAAREALRHFRGPLPTRK